MSCQVPVPAFCEPGACSSSCDIWRPLTGSDSTSRGLTLTPIRADEMSTIGAGQCLTVVGCEAFDRLIGSRVLIGNLEFRFPLLRPFGAASSRMYGPLPVEVAFFADGEGNTLALMEQRAPASQE